MKSNDSLKPPLSLRHRKTRHLDHKLGKFYKIKLIGTKNFFFSFDC